MGFSLDDTASDEIGVRVGKSGGNAEHTPDRLGLLLENAERHLVAFLSVASYGFGCGDHRLGVRQGMVWVFGQPIWEQIFRNARQRRNAFQIAVKTTVAFRDRLIVLQQIFKRNSNMTQLTCHAARAANDATVVDNAAAAAGTDDCRYGREPPPICADEALMR